ncbi:glutamate synthase [Legionella birminghamensis]|uniref:Glutamate synthase n=1 Tax=Legionella birminghamensis TaxID=28083 RepID=A0A378ICM2_9GAMM|nr:glutamate synthase large subunit [Legionella birminghamensis]KTC75451.1 glutamate synthase [Legionella birminghamensis]STX32676.1 glutamate synthase [Legionella birminghamensis]
MAIIEKDNCGCGFIASINGKASHRIIKLSLTALQRLTHRGAAGEDGLSADGCGVMIQLPELFFRKYAKEQGWHLNPRFAVGMCFLNPAYQQAQKEKLDEALNAQGFSVAGWRDLPVDSHFCGAHALGNLPHIAQVLVNIDGALEHSKAEAKLMLARHQVSTGLNDDPFFYICSLSAKVLVYKALVLPQYLPAFYKDLRNTNLKSAFSLFHQRFSTNTLPSWRLTQPFRFLAHNGEINTIQGNRHAVLARSRLLLNEQHPCLDDIRPIVEPEASDSASLDNMLEFLVRGGMSAFQAIRLLIQPAWQNHKMFDAAQQAFFNYCALQMEPWDGPASVVFTDGQIVCCALDRNGFRPARYLQSRDGLVLVCSEAGVIDLAEENILCKGRIGPGELLAVDIQAQQVMTSDFIDSMLTASSPYAAWLQDYTYRPPLRLHQALSAESLDNSQAIFYRKLYDISYEELHDVLKVMAETGKEATASMGDDTPIALLSTQNRPLFDYFRQQFAQVTNPAMDSLRESVIMSTEITLGRQRNIFERSPAHAQRIILRSPVLSSAEWEHLAVLGPSGYPCANLELSYTPQETLADAIERLCSEALQAVNEGFVFLRLSDIAINPQDIPLHPLLAVGAIHQSLVETGKRYDCNLLVASGWVRDPHHFAALLAYGAAAVYPYLAYSLIHDFQIENGLANYVKAIEGGLLKISAKMGIATLASYCGTQLFEIIGLSRQVLNRCFSQSASKLEVLEFADLDNQTRAYFDNAHNPYSHPRHGGLLKYLPDNEYHEFNPDVVMALLEAAKQGDHQLYQRFSELIQQRPFTALRDLLLLKPAEIRLPLVNIEPAVSIFPRFETAAMSLGALSPEAHEALAVAMNTLGGRSNSGEGGEAEYRHKTIKRSKIKQIASGRFGVTADFLVNADVIQIKIAQGAKPGEGGQLPGSKVNETIARLRYCGEGVTLISPPPHHDIYSIEDLAQLIFDLKQVNPEALIAVKLVSGPGVGTIAAGVVKAYADIITISGYDGGTGASPTSSIKYTGSPWELGLHETHQLLLENNLRHRVILQVDGGLKTGMDVVKAALLGAESFGFGTAPMVALGCKYLRICHLNNCATGIATQDDFLRENHYQGSPQRVIHYFKWLAEEVREILADLGFSSLQEIIGRRDLLQKIASDDPFTRRIDLSFMLDKTESDSSWQWRDLPKTNKPRDKAKLAQGIQEAVEPLLSMSQPVRLHFPIRNDDRSIGARLAGYVAKQFGFKKLADETIQIAFTGSAGQSFGAWTCQGISLCLTGEANDYVAKGISGGKIVIKPPAEASYPSNEMTIAGNTCLYGATGGCCYMAGQVGERFAVRNSGAIAVIEGAGAHCCEYMTAGVVLVLGETGINFGAGMTGGLAFVLDLNDSFSKQCNSEFIEWHRLTDADKSGFTDFLEQLLENHTRETGSRWGQQIKDSFDEYLPLFWLVKPKSTGWDTLLMYERK